MKEKLKWKQIFKSHFFLFLLFSFLFSSCNLNKNKDEPEVERELEKIETIEQNWKRFLEKIENLRNDVRIFDEELLDVHQEIKTLEAQLQQKRERERVQQESQENIEIVLQRQFNEDVYIANATKINPGKSGWDKIRDFGYRWFSLRRELFNPYRELNELEQIPHFEIRTAFLHSAGFTTVQGFVKTAATFYIKGKIEKGDEYIRLGSIVLDQVLNPDPNFNLRDHLHIISPVPSSEWDYQLQMPEGERKLELTKIYETLFTFDPFSLLGVYAKKIGLKSAQFADKAYLEEDIEAGELGTNVAIAMTDVMLSFTPITNWKRDLSEALIGINIQTGDSLSSNERILAAMGTLTWDHGNDIKYLEKGFQFIETVALDKFGNLNKVLRGLRRFLEIVQELEIKSISFIKRNASILSQWKSTHFKKIRIKNASVLNTQTIENRLKPAYLNGTQVIEFETTQANEWACVHGSDNKCLVLVRVEDIEGLNLEFDS